MLEEAGMVVIMLVLVEAGKVLAEVLVLSLLKVHLKIHHLDIV